MNAGDYHINVQCTDPITGETGDFIAGFEDGKKTRVSPLFNSLAYLYPWMHQNGWKSDEYIDLGPDRPQQFVPWRVTRTS